MSPPAFVAWIDSDEVLSTVSVSLMAPGSMTSSAMGVSLAVESKIVSETASFRAPAALAMRSVVVVSVSVGAERSLKHFDHRKIGHGSGEDQGFELVLRNRNGQRRDDFELVIFNITDLGCSALSQESPN